MHPWIDFMFEIVIHGAYARAMDYYHPKIKNVLGSLMPRRLQEGFKNHLALMESKAMHRLNMKTDRLDLMTRMAAPENGLSKEEFVGSADTILLGGSETTSTLLSGVTYHLLRNPAYLERLVNEIRSTFKSEDEINSVSVNQLDYMLACLNEGFRIYPPVPGALPRRTLADDTFCGKPVPAGVSIYSIPLY